ncbi:hypothetical protein FE257_008896 [Aspergillus nanangensis]|uniref:BZIP domain-containing protein n=1 Tax=Aspergillus nanangensis TaxID=2582783 RepID=A0AAD4CWC6_ASPNN|nr:hypothetical protein FE257_008896 [Aspergillus nanangensis]
MDHQRRRSRLLRGMPAEFPDNVTGGMIESLFPTANETIAPSAAFNVAPPWEQSAHGSSAASSAASSSCTLSNEDLNGLAYFLGQSRDLKNTLVRNGQPTPPPYPCRAFPQGISSNAASQLWPTESPAATIAQPGAPVADVGQPTSGGFISGPSRQKPNPNDSRTDDSEEDEATKNRPEHIRERNRLAAVKCREKKKGEARKLEARYDKLKEENDKLRKEAANMLGDLYPLRNELITHADACEDAPLHDYIQNRMLRIDSNMSSLILGGSSRSELVQVPQPSQAPQPVPAPQEPELGDYSGIDYANITWQELYELV